MRVNRNYKNYSAAILLAAFFLFVPFKMQAAGLGICLVPYPGLGASPTSLDFGSVQHNSNKTLTVQLDYTASCLNIFSGPDCSCSVPSSVTVDVVSNNGRFAVVGSSAISVNSSGTTAVSIRFTPDDHVDSIYSGELTFTIRQSSVPGGNVIWNGQEIATVSITGVGYVPKPNIDISATSFDFGDTLVGSQAARTLTIYNIGDATLDVSSISVAAPFSATPSSFSLTPGSQRNVTLRFNPSSRGNISKTLSIISNDPDAGSLGLGLSGKGVAPYLNITPSSHDFGTIPVGESQEQSFTIENLALSDSTTLSLSSFSMSGSSFSHSGPGATSLAPGEQTTVGITFAPGSTGSKSGTLSFNTNDPSHASAGIGVSGAAVAPSINPSTLNMDLGDVHIGSNNSMILTLSNTGSLPLSVSSFSLPHASVSVTPSSSLIQPGNFKDFTVRFAPTTRYTLADDLIVHSNDPVLPGLAVALTGQGVSPFITTISTINFGNVYINPSDPSAGTGQTLDLEIANIGNEDLDVSSIASTNASFSPLSTSVTVPQGDSRIVQVHYQPPSVANHSGTLKIYSNDVDHPVKSLSLQGEGVSFLDLSVDKIEVTQAIQTEQNDLPMVAGKETVVRAYINMELSGGVAGGDQIRQVDGILRIRRNGTEVSGSPFQSVNGPITVYPVINRNVVNHTLNFLIPSSITACTGCSGRIPIEFDLEVNPSSGSRVPQIPENDVSNNSKIAELGFYDNYTPLIYYIPIAITDEDGNPLEDDPLPNDSRMSQGADLFRKIYPVRAIRYTRRPPVAYMWLTSVNNLFRGLFFASHLGTSTAPDRTYGWLPKPLLGRIAGIAEDIPGRVAFGRQGVKLSDGQETFAHELGHTYGLCHTQWPVEQSCYSDFPDGHLVEHGTIREVGFDTGTMQTILPIPAADWAVCIDIWADYGQCCIDNGGCDACSYPFCPGYGNIDFMGYEGANLYKRWINPQRWSLLFQRLRSRDADPSNATGCLHGGCVQKQGVILVAGSIGVDNTADLAPIYSAEAVPDLAAEESSDEPYVLRALDSSGEVLLEYPLSAPGGQSGEQGAEEIHTDLNFSIIMPDLTGLHTIQLFGESGLLLERVRSNQAPELTLMSPSAGETIQAILTVEWEGDDADGDDLVYSVLYSADDGGTYQTIGTDLRYTIFQYDASRLAGSDTARIKVIATDGFNTSDIESDPFSVSSKAPQVLITSPAQGQTFLAGAPISIGGSAFDLEDGELSDAIDWNSNIAGPIGQGSRIGVVLAEGQHRITATITDSDGESDSKEIDVLVVNGAQAPRANAGNDQNVSEGDVVILDAGQSEDPNAEDILSYFWQQIDGSNVTLDDPYVISPTFTVPQVTEDTTLRFLLQVTDPSGNIATDTVDVNVSNTSYASITLDMWQLDFGTVNVGEKFQQSVVLTNDGNETLEINAIKTTRDVFDVNPSQATVAPGASLNLNIAFSPYEEARYEAVAWITSNAQPMSPRVIILKGNTPKPQATYIDHGGGSLLPLKPAVSPSESGAEDNGMPFESNGVPEAPGDEGPYGFGGGGGCSLMRPASMSL